MAWVLWCRQHGFRAPVPQESQRRQGPDGDEVLQPAGKAAAAQAAAATPVARPPGARLALAERHRTRGRAWSLAPRFAVGVASRQLIGSVYHDFRTSCQP